MPYGDRGGVPVEPFLTEQWYADAKKLAQAPIAAARDGRVKFVPERGRDDFFRWMENIEPWCISRQLWWGHQIPAWYGPDKKVFVALSEDEAKAEARKHYGKDVALERDPDVLDTWFSSALWPFSTLGWPEQTVELAKYYPTSVLVTGWDILFFWVARMMMMGMHFMKEVPFRTVYLHGLVTDEKGQKMSKSKGNVIDPLELIDKYGADALRFTMTSIAASQAGRLRLAPARVEGSRNFATKLWNATRFAEMNGAALPKGFDPAGVEAHRQQVDAGRTRARQRRDRQGNRRLPPERGRQHALRIHLGHRLRLVCRALQADPAGRRRGGEGRDARRHGLRAARDGQAPASGDAVHHRGDLGQDRPSRRARRADRPALAGAGRHRCSGGRRDRLAGEADLRHPLGPRRVECAGRRQAQAAGRRRRRHDAAQRLETHRAAIERLARIDGVEATAAAPKGALQIVVGEATYALPVGDVIDLKAEGARLQKEIKKLADEVGKIDAKLGNAAFVSRAPEEVVEEQRERRTQAEQTRARLSTALERLGA